MTDQAARPAGVGRTASGNWTVPAQRVVLGGLAMLSAPAAVIHFAVAGRHFQEYWLFGVFLLGVAWLQLGWAAAALFRPTRLLVSSGRVSGGAGMAGMTSPGSSGSTGTMAPVHLATSSPAGFITDPDPGMQMEPGMKMASPVACTAAATAAQQRAAVQLVNASWRGAQQYRSLAAAR